MAATDPPSIICRSRELVDRGRGIRFSVRRHGETVPAFVIRFGGAVHAYLNRCGHRSLELDWNEGDFLDADGQLIVCATHGALFEPATGRCVAGPCRGAALQAVAVRDDGESVVAAE